jgi:hypothetical protein
VVHFLGIYFFVLELSELELSELELSELELSVLGRLPPDIFLLLLCLFWQQLQLAA